MTQPTQKIRKGKFSAAIFENENGTSVNIQKSYKKKGSEEWVNQNISVFPEEIDNLIGVLQEAKEAVTGAQK